MTSIYDKSNKKSTEKVNPLVKARNRRTEKIIKKKSKLIYPEKFGYQ
jgi:hypothetical protein